nr:NAD(P)(+)--arginine ADP-ribosyltransferase 2-like [Danio rerio]XP_021327480.1 NAD(P)(+)--arginine ADP-ribosyltransferase 2-like isoform X1 [Danio rerio]|eukprot:XP_009296554.2 NAD(P)(+)--arginine ADP-ribosyltransferase 2-like [Danio rerio]
MLLMIETLLLIFAALEQDHRAFAAGSVYPLDKALNSVDAQYKDCKVKMANLVKTKYLKKELNSMPVYKKVWKAGEKKYVKKPVGPLTKNHLIALYVYTDSNLYKDFNSATRNGRKQYTQKTFKWYSLHFLLTEAVQILRKTQGCMKTYRGTSVEFTKNVLNKEIRFGSFASSSLDPNVAQSFGSVSCFEILTCHGAHVGPYSQFFYEKEVLIPPYEKFRVTAVRTKQYHFNLWCNTVYTLKSTGTKSDLNCAMTSKKAG